MSVYVMQHPFQEFNSAGALLIHLDIDHNLKFTEDAPYSQMYHEHAKDHRHMAADRRAAIDAEGRS